MNTAPGRLFRRKAPRRAGNPGKLWAVIRKEMREASIALMRLVPTESGKGRKVGAAVGTVAVGTGIRMPNRLG